MKFIVVYLVVLALLLVNLAQTSALADSVYWTSQDSTERSIQRANLDGSGVETVVAGVFPFGIALDVAGGYMYWTTHDLYPDNKIQRANLDGTRVTDLVTGLNAPVGIALDVAGGQMYWTDTVDNTIQLANLDGTGVTDLITGLNRPRGIALDIDGGQIYWADLGSDTIKRANLDGSGVTDLITGTGLGSVQHIALDLLTRQIYWTDVIVDTIRRANLDGTGLTDLVGSLDDPTSIALDIGGGQMYWSDFVSSLTTAETIKRANLDGTGVTTLIMDLPDVSGLALEISLAEPCTIDIDPDTLNLKSKGRFIACYIELPEGHYVEDIDIDSVILTEISSQFLNPPLYPVGPSDIGDYNNNGISDLMVKFDRQSVQERVPLGEVEITVKAQTYDEISFEGTETVLVIDEGQEHYSEDQSSVVY